MRAALQLPVEKLEQMGRAGAERVRERHDAVIEASKLAALFRSSIEPLQDYVTIGCTAQGVSAMLASTPPGATDV